MRAVPAIALSALLATAALLNPGSARATGQITCEMTFELHGWSVFYKKSDGTGQVTCSNGERMSVHLRSRGGGFTFGTQSITGTGRFTGIFHVREILGTYATGGAHAGIVNAANATVMTKGNVSLALSGTGKGWNVGVDFGKFTISR